MPITYTHNVWRGNTVWDIVWKLHVTHYVNTHNVWREEYSVEHNGEITYNAHTICEQGSIIWEYEHSEHMWTQWTQCGT